MSSCSSRSSEARLSSPSWGCSSEATGAGAVRAFSVLSSTPSCGRERGRTKHPGALKHTSKSGWVRERKEQLGSANSWTPSLIKLSERDVVIRFYVRSPPADGRDNLAQNTWCEQASSESSVHRSAPRQRISPLVNQGEIQELCSMGPQSIPSCIPSSSTGLELGEGENHHAFIHL